MLSSLDSHNKDINLLLQKGYALAIDSNCLVVRDIPYLNNVGDLKWGAFVSKLIFTNKEHVQMDDHQIYFCGEPPYELDGKPIRNLGGGPISLPLSSPDLAVQRSFSNKPSGGFRDLFEKIEHYVQIIAGPAMNKHDVSPLTFKSVDAEETSVFHYRDTLTSRAAIGDLASKFADDVVAIIGLGRHGFLRLGFSGKNTREGNPRV